MLAVQPTPSRMVALCEMSQAPIIAANALLYDAAGGTWVHQQAAPHSFVRRRVEVVRVEEGAAFLSPRSLHPSGLRIGDLIVTDGAMEIFGTEFGCRSPIGHQRRR